MYGYDHGQLNNAAVAISVCDDERAPYVLQLAILYAAMGESGLTVAGGGGVWQDTSSPDPSNVEHEAHAWLHGLYGFRNGGGWGLWGQGWRDPVNIANATEENAAWLYHHQDSYGHQWPGGSAEGLSWAAGLIRAYRDGRLGYGQNPAVPPLPSGFGNISPNLPPVAKYDPSPIITAATDSMSLHGQRAFRHATDILRSVNQVRYVTEKGPHA